MSVALAAVTLLARLGRLAGSAGTLAVLVALCRAAGADAPFALWTAVAWADVRPGVEAAGAGSASRALTSSREDPGAAARFAVFARWPCPRRLVLVLVGVFRMCSSSLGSFAGTAAPEGALSPLSLP